MTAETGRDTRPFSDEPTDDDVSREPAEDEIVLAQELDRVRKERDGFLAQWQRAQADYQNLKKRTATEVDSAVRRALAPLLGEALLLIDNLDLALASSAAAGNDELANGVRLSREKFLRGLEAAGVQPIPRKDRFDPQTQEAVATSERADLEPGTVLDVLREGYTHQGQVLRPAQVRVSTRARGPG